MAHSGIAQRYQPPLGTGTPIGEVINISVGGETRSFRFERPIDYFRRYRADSQEILRTHAGAIPYILMLEGAFRESDVIPQWLNRERSDYSLPFEILDLKPLLLELAQEVLRRQGREPRWVNLKQSRLCDFSLAGDKTLTLSFQITSYFDSIATNLLADVLDLSSGRTVRDILEGERPGRLPKLYESLYANHLGISCVGITRDERILYKVRSKAELVHPDTLDPTISGSHKWIFRDNKPPWYGYHRVVENDPVPCPFAAIRAQGYEELGLEPSDFGDLVLIGGARELIRGGKPEFFFLAELTASYKEIQERIGSTQPEDRWEYEDLQKDLASDQARWTDNWKVSVIERVIDPKLTRPVKGQRLLGPPLAALFCLLRRYLS